MSYTKSRTGRGVERGVPLTTQDVVGRSLLVLAAVSAAGAMVAGLGSLADSSPDVLIVETWRVAGLGVFAGIFGLLAYRPRRFAGIWELGIAHKLILMITGLVAPVGTVDAGMTAAVDGGLALILLVAYVLCRGWRSWAYTRSDLSQ